MVMRVAIIGCGLIGNKRAAALGKNTLTAVVDVHRDRAVKLAANYPGCEAATDWRTVVCRESVDAVIVATTNDMLAPITLQAVRHGKHVLVEKPAARNAAELAPVIEAAAQSAVTVKVGFNHRFHPALMMAKSIFDRGELGPLMYIRARYGHGGRIGYDREWRADAAICGGGEMLDQGVHLIDLSRWFAGDFVEATGHVATLFWNMPVEDNGFACLRTAAGQVAWLHASCTEWKNLFCFEVFGRDGKLQIDGLGRSYGTEKLTHFRMLPQMGPPETQVWEFPGEDRSWEEEFSDFSRSIAQGTPPLGSLQDAAAALRIIETIYSRSSGPTAART